MLVNSSGTQVIQITWNKPHLVTVRELCDKVMLLVVNGKLFSWGKNAYGQLGVGPDVLTSDTPLPVSSLQVR